MMESLMMEPQKNDGTAYFELHLVDDMVPMKEPEESLAAFNRERYTFASSHLSQYQPIKARAE